MNADLHLPFETVLEHSRVMLKLECNSHCRDVMELTDRQYSAHNHLQNVEQFCGIFNELMAYIKHQNIFMLDPDNEDYQYASYLLKELVKVIDIEIYLYIIHQNELPQGFETQVAESGYWDYRSTLKDEIRKFAKLSYHKDDLLSIFLHKVESGYNSSLASS